MDWIIENPGQSLVTIGIVLLIVEMLLLGFSTFILTFVGLSTIVTGIAIAIGLLPSDLLTILVSNAVLASVFALLLWKPLKQFQNRQDTHAVKNDLIGLEFVLPDSIGPSTSCKHRLSGVEWQVKSATEISAETSVTIVKTDVGVLWVEAA